MVTTFLLLPWSDIHYTKCSECPCLQIVHVVEIIVVKYLLCIIASFGTYVHTYMHKYMRTYMQAYIHTYRVYTPKKIKYDQCTSWQKNLAIKIDVIIPLL